MSLKKQGAPALRRQDRSTPADGPQLKDASRELETFDAPFRWGMVYLFARIFYEMRSRTEEALKPHGLTPIQATILGTLERWPGLSSAELSRRFGVTPQTMGEMVANLERRNLVVRTQDPGNRRALRLNLTGEGRRMVELCNVATLAVEKDMFSAFTPKEVAELNRQLGRLHDHMGLVSG